MKFDASNRLSPDKFVWEKFIGKIGYSQTEVVKDWAKVPWELNPDYELVGWVESNKLVIRNRSEGITVMLEHKETGEQLWLHWLT